jgi:hypothetical protein
MTPWAERNSTRKAEKANTEQHQTRLGFSHWSKSITWKIRNDIQLEWTFTDQSIRNQEKARIVKHRKSTALMKTIELKQNNIPTEIQT